MNIIKRLLIITALATVVVGCSAYDELADGVYYENNNPSYVITDTSKVSWGVL